MKIIWRMLYINRRFVIYGRCIDFYNKMAWSIVADCDMYYTHNTLIVVLRNCLY